MEIKQERLLFFKVLSVVIIILFVNVGIFFYKNAELKGFTGLAINSADGLKETVVNSYKTMPMVARIFLGVQWFLLIFLLIYIIFRDRRVKGSNFDISTLNKKRKSANNKTDLDIIYDTLKENKVLGISTIARAFQVKEDIALEWCKILESGDLAVVDYPGFRAPLIKLKEEVEKENIQDKKIDEKKPEDKKVPNIKLLKKEIKKPVKKIKKKKKHSKTKLNKKLKK